MMYLHNIIERIKKTSTKQKTLVIFLALVGITSLFFMFKSFSPKDVTLDEVILKGGNNDNGMFAIMLEQEDGTYTESSDNTWPSSGYNFNSTKSGCIDSNGTTIPDVLSYDSENKMVKVRTNKAAYCYLYFSLPIPDLKVTGVDTTKLATGKYTKSIDCGDTGSATFDTKYQRLEFGNITAPVECTINYTEDTTTYPKLNQTIIDMAVEGTSDGTNQAEGDVVHEVEVLASDATYTKLMQDGYGTITNTSTYPFIWDETNSQWTQTATVAKSSSYFKFYPSKSGFYQICYTLPSSAYTSSSSSYKNYITLYSTNTTSTTLKTVYSNYNSGDTITGCVNYGYVTSSDYIYIRGYYYDNNISFYAQMTNDTESLDTGYRYEGKSPNNYIWFNNELWRIIGVFDTCTALDDSGNCTKTETLTKIMRNESIGGLVREKSSNNNNWTSSSLYKLLNTNYLNSTNGTDSGYCYGYSDGYSAIVKANCDYSEIGLKGTNSYYGSMIKSVVWNLGGMSSTSGAENYYGSPASTWYIYERGTIVYSGNDTKTTGYIGLMYGSDYGYSVKASSNCNRSKTLNSYNTAYCASESWMYGQGPEWMINPNSSNGYLAWNVLYDNYSNGGSIYTITSGYAVRPVLYLDSTVYVINGEEENVGSINNPYQIAKQ